MLNYEMCSAILPSTSYTLVLGALVLEGGAISKSSACNFMS